MAPYITTRYYTDSSTTVWASWNSQTCEGTECTSTWDYWNNDICTITGNSYDTWGGWCENVDNDTVWNNVVDSAIQHKTKRLARTLNFRERLLKRKEKQRRKDLTKIEIHKRNRDAAEIKAKELLLDLIGEDQLKIYNETGRLFVRGRKNDYIIHKHGCVKKLEKDKVVDLCIHLNNKTKYPETDNVIALKLLIEGNEEKFTKTAHHVYSGPVYDELPKCACMK